MIFTDQDGSVWISGQMVCKDAFPLFPMFPWWPVFGPVHPAGGGFLPIGSGCIWSRVTSGLVDTSEPEIFKPTEPNPFYHGYDSLE